MTEKKKNIIVVLNYNDWEETKRFCEVVKGFSCVDQILIVDNLSTDDSVEHLSTITDNKILLLKASYNKGYAAGNNIGIDYVLKQNIKANIIISNPDIYLSNEDLEMVLEPLEDKSIGVTTGLIHTDGKVTSNYAWKVPSFSEILLNQFLSIYKIKRFINHSMYLPYPKTEDNIICGCVSGCFFCITTDTIKQIGLFDERTFLYGEENILGFKIRQNGQKECVVTKAKIEHRQHHSINKIKNNTSRSKNWFLDSNEIFLKYYLRKSNFMLRLFRIAYALAQKERRLLGI